MGALCIHPWDLWEYSFEDYLLRREGYYKEQRRLLNQHWQHTRLQIYYSIVYDSNLSAAVRKKKIDKLVPDFYDETRVIEKDADWYAKQRAHAKMVTDSLKKRAGLNKKPRNSR